MCSEDETVIAMDPGDIMNDPPMEDPPPPPPPPTFPAPCDGGLAGGTYSCFGISLVLLTWMQVEGTIAGAGQMPQPEKNMQSWA